MELSDVSTAHGALAAWAERTPDRDFLFQPVERELQTTTFREAEDIVRRMAAALLGLGLSPGDNVAILSKNCAEWLLADMAIAMAGLVSIPIYPTANADTVSYILGHSESKAMFIGKLDDPDGIASAVPDSLPTISFPYPTIGCQHTWQDLIDAAEPITEAHAPAAGDVMTILYTSGSTGRPKGVVTSYGAYDYSCNATREFVNLGEHDRLLSYLPLSHVTERMALIGPAIYAGAAVYFVETLETFMDDLKVARPTLFGSVPRLWVKFQAGIHAQIPPGRLKFLLALPIIGGLVAKRIREGMGFDACKAFASGSAPISPHTLRWYRKLGIDIGEGWGMSETSGLSCGNMPYEARRIGTIGVPVPGTEMKVSDMGEILIRGPGLFTEYYKNPELTAESFIEGGYFRTGDKGEWDEKVNGFRITGRVKEIFKSAKGKYVVPVPIESRLSGNPLIEQVCVIGSGMPAPVAVGVLSEAGRNLPKENVERSLRKTLEQTNAALESHERLANLMIVNDEWTPENGLLTPTLKLKRDQLEARYQDYFVKEPGDLIAWESGA
jgi:long-subunit acyl-CoA synthetase (AMP-forming)